MHHIRFEDFQIKSFFLVAFINQTQKNDVFDCDETCIR